MTGRPKGAISWPPEALHRLRSLWAEECWSMKEIAETISHRDFYVTRSAVAGMLRRLGLQREVKGPRPKPKQKQTLEERRDRAREHNRKWREKRKQARKATASEEVALPQSLTALIEPAITKVEPEVKVIKAVARAWAPRARSLPADGRPVPLLDLGQGCKWPVAHEDGQHLHCNMPRADLAYCQRHLQMAYTMGARRY